MYGTRYRQNNLNSGLLSNAVNRYADGTAVKVDFDTLVFRNGVQRKFPRRFVTRNRHRLLSFGVPERRRLGKRRVHKTKLHIQRRSRVPAERLALLQDARQAVGTGYCDRTVNN